jgi:hypothetical protein
MEQPIFWRGGRGDGDEPPSGATEEYVENERMIGFVVMVRVILSL